MTVIKIENLKKSYGNHNVLKGMNLKVEKGEIYGLLGPNGAGKTTFFQTILGLLKQDSGKVTINGKTNPRGKKVKREIGYLPSDISFYENRTAVENLEFFSDLADKNPDIDHLLELVGLTQDKNRNVGDYSTGMKKRLGIAQSLIKEPDIAIYDEPTTGLDPEGKNNFRHHVEKINKEKEMTIIISSHITGEISDLCDRFGILADGVIKASGSKEELSRKAGNERTIQLKTENPRETEELLEKQGKEFEKEGRHFQIPLENDRKQILQNLTEAKVGVINFSVEGATLESAYIELTR